MFLLEHWLQKSGNSTQIFGMYSQTCPKNETEIYLINSID